MAALHVVQTHRSPHPAQATPFRCVREDDRGGVAWVEVEGDLDIATSPALAAALTSPGDPPLVIVDLRAVTFMDSSGVHVIVDSAAAVQARGSRLVVVPGPPHVDAVFEMTGHTRPS